ncbi:MAG: hypothetical protein JNL10_22085 [Verrucomicrobiales bacterium]|nr:hypothetical protein [Verrucomicrobiales bacterium]
MPPTPSSHSLQLRKQLLLLESELNRAALREDLDRIRSKTSWLGGLAGNPDAAPASSWLIKAAPLAGILATAAAGPAGGWLKRGLRLVQIAAAAYPIWKAFTAGRSKSRPE